MSGNRHVNRDSPLALIVIGLFFAVAPPVAVFVLSPDPVTGLRSASCRWTGPYEVPLWFGILFNSFTVLVGLAMLISGVRRLIFGPPRGFVSPRSQGLCHKCKYPLHGVPGPKCPECGTPIVFRRVEPDG